MTDERLEKAYQTFADSLSQPVSVIRQFYENSKEAHDVFKQKALEKEAMDYVIGKGKLKQVEMETEKDEGEK
jgi:FKBP-type peptidyl-prolyl cis-trans isomerase (trigger factor)